MAGISKQRFAWLTTIATRGRFVPERQFSLPGLRAAPNLHCSRCSEGDFDLKELASLPHQLPVVEPSGRQGVQ